MHSTTGVCRMSESVLCHMCVFSRLSRLKWFVLATKNARHHRCVKDVRNFSLCENTLVSYIYITTQFSHHTQRMHSITGVCRMSESFICTRIHMYHTCISPPPFSHTIRVYSHTILPKWEKKNIRREYTNIVWECTSESKRERESVCRGTCIFLHRTPKMRKEEYSKRIYEYGVRLHEWERERESVCAGGHVYCHTIRTPYSYILWPHSQNQLASV